MGSQVTNYQCPSCTGPLRYGSSSGKLECEYCGSMFDVEEIEKLYLEKDEAAVVSLQKSEQEESQWDTSYLSDDWGEDSEKLKVYNCPSCGAQLICDDTTAATSCPYCGNNTIVPGKFSGTLKPDYIIPFGLKKEDAVDRLKKFYKGKWLLPKEFTAQNHINEIKGVYIPFWLYDAIVNANLAYNATRSFTHREGDYRVTETDHYHVIRKGSVEYHYVPADGSKKMNNEYMDSIEPYDYKGLKPFSNAYLPGYLADKYDVSAKQNAKRADKRCTNTTKDIFARDVVGYDTLSLKNESINIQRGKVSYALFPVWILHTKWNEQDFLFMMNGQTGKFVGELPVSKQKYRMYFTLVTVLLFGVLEFTGVAKFVAVLLQSLFK